MEGEDGENKGKGEAEKVSRKGEVKDGKEKDKTTRDYLPSMCIKHGHTLLVRKKLLLYNLTDWNLSMVNILLFN